MHRPVRWNPARRALAPHVWSCPEGPGAYVDVYNERGLDVDEDDLYAAADVYAEFPREPRHGGDDYEIRDDWHVRYKMIELPSGPVWAVRHSGIENFFTHNRNWRAEMDAVVDEMERADDERFGTARQNPTPLVTKGPNITDDQLSEGTNALLKWMSTHYDKDTTYRASDRYSFNLDGVRRHWNTDTFEFSIKPLTSSTVFRPTRTEAEYRKPGAEYKKPADALEEIPVNPNWAYRGMSWEEWQSIRETGHISSKSSHNFNTQQGLTFFGYEPGTGVSYSSGFAPWWYAPAYKRPGVVIAVPKHLLLTHKDRPRSIAESELAHEGPLDASTIKDVWFITPVKVFKGQIDIVFNKHSGAVEEGSRSSPSVTYAIHRARTP